MSPAHDLIERLYEEHHGAVLRFARSREPRLAEDVAAETFAVALRRAEVIPPDAERAWLIGVADNVLRNQQRKERRAASLPEVLRPHQAASSAPHEVPVVGPAMQELPPTERDVLTLTAFEGLSSGEAAARLGLTPGSARNAMVRARRNLAVQLGVFSVLLLAPFVYLLLRDTSRAVPQAERLARSLDRALSVETEATVTRTGGRRERYGIAVDRRSAVQRITLPDGQVAEGPVGGELRIVPRSSVSVEQRRAARRTHAAALAALETITSGDLQRFLERARRADAQSTTTGRGDEQVTVVEGPLTTHDGRRVELRVTLAGDPAALRQLRIRPAGRATGWTTVDLRRWQLRLPATDRSGGTSVTPGPTANASQPPPAGGRADRGPW